MQFFRKWYTGPELMCYLPENTILNDLSTWGFVELDGSPIPQIYENPMINQHPFLRWRYNTNTSICFTYHVFGGLNFWDGEAFGIYGSNQARRLTYSSSTVIGDYRSIIFIPLRNRGFLINSGREFYYSTKHNQAPTLYGFFEELEPNSSEDAPLGGFMFYNNIANSFDFTWFIQHSDANHLYDAGYVAMQTNNLWNWGSLLYDAHGGSHTEITTNHNIQQNVCTLIKYPYQNGFLSNLFLIYTSPCNDRESGGTCSTGLWNKFFSFGGRNFYCPMGNLAVELPSN